MLIENDTFTLEKYWRKNSAVNARTVFIILIAYEESYLSLFFLY